MPASQPANFNLQEFSDAGLLLFGGRLYTYAYGTTAQKTAYTDPAGAVPHTYTADGAGGQYIALNARGELPAPLYLTTGAYDIALKRADGSTVWTRRADPTGDGVTTLATSIGAARIGAAGRVARTVQQQLDILAFGMINVNDPNYGADPTGVVDSTAAFQAAIDDMVAQGYQTHVGAITGGYVSIAPLLHGKPGVYTISDTLRCPAYFRADITGMVIIQSNPTKDIFHGDDAYQWEVRGGHLVGGRHQAYLQNNNLDVTKWNFTGTTFSLSSDFAVKTWPTLGATSHLSANLDLIGCTWYKPRQALLNYCDSANVSGWVFVSKDNFAANTAVFVNGSLTTDGFPNLYLDHMFGVPGMGTGANRVLGTRWVDHNAGAVHGYKSRFGGEDAGIPPVYFNAPPKTVYPFIGTSIIFDDCEILAGPSTATDSGVVVLNGQVPNHISITRNKGPIDVPYIINYGGQIANFDTYFSNFETASGQKAHRYFGIDIAGNRSHGPDGVLYPDGRIPTGLRKYVNGSRETKVRRAAPQVITTGFASNFVAFDTVVYDTQGGFDITNPTRLLMPLGATRARITIYVKLDGTFTGGIFAVRLVTSGAAEEAAQELALNANADGTSYSVTADVNTSPGDYFRVNLLTNAAANQNMIACTVTTRASDYIN